MHRLLFLSSISLVACGGGGCGDDACGPGDAPDTGLIVGDQDQKLTFGNLTSGANNDCPDPSAPSGVVSLTVNGSQTDGQGLLTLCIPRPDQLPGGVPIGTGVRIIDLSGVAMSGGANCNYSIEQTRPVSGTALGHGVCDNGTNGAGYSLVFDGHLSLKRECPTATDTIAVNISGEVAVDAH